MVPSRSASSSPRPCHASSLVFHGASIPLSLAASRLRASVLPCFPRLAAPCLHPSLTALPLRLSRLIVTNGEYKSCVHRAITNPDRARLSVETFHDPAKTVRISPASELIDESPPAKYQGVVYGDYVKSCSSMNFTCPSYCELNSFLQVYNVNALHFLNCYVIYTRSGKSEVHDGCIYLLMN
ncbi:gibberellin 3-beta-dioxygenase 1-like [Arachis duranensis]|uniref:Gibberellin 3-beta-dioxygenase 1-like n=1 Tax=Arachis duranensis TaxID=130453 RepID=A0A9C6WRF4_ARADU|nr:gibberellin 3-beta-dioxygenase 1-like [Arachis duranensis]